MRPGTIIISKLTPGFSAVILYSPQCMFHAPLKQLCSQSFRHVSSYATVRMRK